MKHVLSTVCCIVLCGAPALAQGNAMTGPSMGPSTADQKFVNMAAQTDMVEANLGQLAQDAASSQQVKDYGQMLATDHTNDFHQLYDAAHQANLNVPDAIDKEHNRTMITPFQKLKGTSFDRRYTREMVAGHTKAIAAYKEEAAHGQNAALKSYAQNALPVLQKHLDGAKDLK